MTYLSVCSGIEAAKVAWGPLGFTPVGFAEIEPFPCELLKQKYPNVKNYGDITQYENWNIGKFDILVGGTPCQSFSIAGKRGGTDDIRGKLMYSYLGIVEQYKPNWIIWENVPGVLSSDKGLDFASFLSGLEKCGYGWAYRVLDAQYFGVPQRRRRVMQRDFKKGGEKQKKPAASIGKGVDYFRRGGNYKYHIDKKASTLRNSASPDCFDLVLDRYLIRRLTPLECERLQGFPDNYTQIEWKGKPKDQCPDSHRYKAIGNSMAVPVMRWIGERIKRIEGEMK